MQFNNCLATSTVFVCCVSWVRFISCPELQVGYHTTTVPNENPISTRIYFFQSRILSLEREFISISSFKARPSIEINTNLADIFENAIFFTCIWADIKQQKSLLIRQIF